MPQKIYMVISNDNYPQAKITRLFHQLLWRLPPLSLLLPLQHWYWVSWLLTTLPDSTIALRVVPWDMTKTWFRIDFCLGLHLKQVVPTIGA